MQTRTISSPLPHFNNPSQMKSEGLWPVIVKAKNKTHKPKIMWGREKK
jgi:hypothetical protein